MSSKLLFSWTFHWFVVEQNVRCVVCDAGCMVLTPDTKVFPVSEGARFSERTSAEWPWKLCSSCPLSTSHNAHVPSPLEVRIWNTNTCAQTIGGLGPDYYILIYSFQMCAFRSKCFKIMKNILKITFIKHMCAQGLCLITYRPMCMIGW